MTAQHPLAWSIHSSSLDQDRTPIRTRRLAHALDRVLPLEATLTAQVLLRGQHPRGLEPTRQLVLNSTMHHPLSQVRIVCETLSFL